MRRSADVTARLMLVALSFAWGLTWPAMRFALNEMPPFSMRVVSTGIGIATVFSIVALQRRNIRVARAVDWVHVSIAGLFSIVGFTMFVSFAQLMSGTSRVAILAYTMPIWSSILARPILGERLNLRRVIALMLCIAGMTVLIYPLAAHGIPLGLVLAVCAAISWSAGTVYMKWAQIEGDPIAVAGWQLVFGFVFVGVCTPLFDPTPNLWPSQTSAQLGLIFTGVIGSGIAYFLWFDVITRVPAITASLGVLMAPMIGVAAAAIMFGERPTVTDLIGFALIFAASACVLLGPNERPSPEPT